MASRTRDRARFVPRPLRRFWEQAPELRPLSLRFRDRTIERAFQTAYFRDNLPYVRLAHVLGVALWAVFAVLARFLLDEGGGTADLVLRFGVATPFVLVSLGLTYARWYPTDGSRSCSPEHDTCRAPNWTEVEQMSAGRGVYVLSLSGRHAKLRREGYRKDGSE